MKIFLTGSTGSLGAHFVLRILQETDHNLTCLARAASQDIAWDRLQDAVNTYDPHFKLSDHKNQLRVVNGDISLHNLGLEGENWATEALHTDIVVHAAADTSLVNRLTTAKKVNLHGTMEVIRFAEATPKRRLMHVSTYSICGDQLLTPGFVFKETDWDVGQTFPHMPYQHSKFLGEGEVRKSKCVTTIVRPGHVFGDSQTGRFFTRNGHNDSLFWDLLKSAHDFKCSFVTDFIFDITPVNYVSAAMLSFLTHDDLGTFHLCQKDALKFESILDVMIAMGYEINKLSIDDYRDLLENGSLQWNGQKFESMTTQIVSRWFRLKELCFDNGARIDTTAAREILEPRGISAAPTDKELLGSFFRQMHNEEAEELKKHSKPEAALSRNPVATDLHAEAELQLTT